MPNSTDKSPMQNLYLRLRENVEESTVRLEKLEDQGILICVW